MKAFLGSPSPAQLVLRAYPDYQQYRVKLNNIPTMSLRTGLPPHPEVILKFIDIEAQDLACPAHWLRPANTLPKENGTIVLAFRSEKVALQFHRRYGTHCRTSLYTDNPPKPHTTNTHGPKPTRTLPYNPLFYSLFFPIPYTLQQPCYIPTHSQTDLTPRGRPNPGSTTSRIFIPELLRVVDLYIISVLVTAALGANTAAQCG